MPPPSLVGRQNPSAQAASADVGLGVGQLARNRLALRPNVETACRRVGSRSRVDPRISHRGGFACDRRAGDDFENIAAVDHRRFCRRRRVGVQDLLRLLLQILLKLPVVCVGHLGFSLKVSRDQCAFALSLLQLDLCSGRWFVFYSWLLVWLGHDRCLVPSGCLDPIAPQQLPESLSRRKLFGT